MQNYLAYSEKILRILESKKILDLIGTHQDISDEPRFFRFSARLTNYQSYSDGMSWDGSASGFSYQSKEFALFKCLMEAAERVCNVAYRKKDLIYKTYNELKNESTRDLTVGVSSLDQTSSDSGKPTTLQSGFYRDKKAVDPALFTEGRKVDDEVIAWVKGKDLFSRATYYIPAQAVYFNYTLAKGEVYLTEPISTGAAGGVDFESTILRGIYEIIERDAFLTAYLIKAPVKRVDLKKIHDSNIRKILHQANKYNLEVNLVDVTNDLGVPVFLCILVDKSGIGPGVTLGLKSSLDKKAAILGALEESFHIRPWLRQEIVSSRANTFKIDPGKIKTITDRGLFWMPPRMADHLKWLLNAPLKKIVLSAKLTKKEELSSILKKLKSKNLKAYYVDIKWPPFKSLDLLFYKVVIPQLQPLFLHEQHPEIRYKRMETVAQFFGMDKIKINKIPHPFL